MSTQIIEIPLPLSTQKNGLTYTRNLGNLTVCYSGRPDDIEIESVEYCGVNILPVIEFEESIGTSPLLQHILDAAAAHAEDCRYDSLRNF